MGTIDFMPDLVNVTFTIALLPRKDSAWNLANDILLMSKCTAGRSVKTARGRLFISL